MLLSQLNFELPVELIAQHPVSGRRSDSRLLELKRTTGEISHRYFYQLPELLAKGDLVLLNDTKVMPARILAHKTTGGKVEILVERILDKDSLLVQLKTGKRLPLDKKLILDNEGKHYLKIKDAVDGLWVLQPNIDPESVLKIYGIVPLPPYIKRSPAATDISRYQTIYARKLGAVAAPTAGLHFDQDTILNLSVKGVQVAFITLHVGLGTFSPIRTENLADHKLHKEYVEVSQEVCDKVKATKSKGNKVVVCGTTTLRALESAVVQGELCPYYGDTELFIYQQYNSVVADALITNFHLPKTSLLALVCAFGGYSSVMNAYRSAIEHDYRFYSYGDAMVIN